jgi:hypothetical protein
MGPSHQSKGSSQFPSHDLVVTQPDVSGRPSVSVDGKPSRSRFGDTPKPRTTEEAAPSKLIRSLGLEQRAYYASEHRECRKR